MNAAKFATFLSALSLSACFATASYSGRFMKKRPANCSFRIVSTLPEGHWEEIGVANVRPGHGGGTLIAPHTPGAFRKLIGDKVCAAGGELVVGEINGLGQYVRGTVFVASKKPVAAQRHPASPTHAPMRGCQYDTQCKGNRICEQGRCVSPAVR